MIRSSFFSAVLLLVGLTSAAPVAAQDWKAEWDRTVAAANQEGALVMNSQPNQEMRNYILGEWAKAYPKIALSLSVTPASQLTARLRTERGADKYLWDLSVSGAAAAYTFYREGIIDPLMPEFILPDVKNPDTWGGWDHFFYDTPRKYVVAMSGALKAPYFNTATVSAEKIKTLGLKVMLEPEYKGKIFWHDPSMSGSGQSFALVLRERLGDDGLRKLIVDQKTNFVAQQEQVIEAFARGTAWIGIGPFARGLLEPYRAAGIKVDVRAFGNEPSLNEMSMGGAGLYVFNKRPHPNATRVFVNWILGADIQYGLAKVSLQDSRRQDVPSISEPERQPIKGATYLETQREENLQGVDDAVKFIADIRKSTR